MPSRRFLSVSNLLKKFRSPLSSSQRAASARRTLITDPSLPSQLTCKYGPNFSFRDKYHWDLIYGTILAGSTGVFVGQNTISAFSDDTYVAEIGSDNDQGEANVTGLRRIEDGSVVSNTHTVKWRIFTDNGRDRFLKGKLDEAEKFFQSALYEAKEGFGPRDPHVASSYNNLAELYRVRKAFEKAEPLYLEAIDILEKAYGVDDVRVGAALHNLGQFYLVQRKLDNAQMAYERALKIEGRVLGYGHPDYANTMYHLGTVLHLQGKAKDSETLIRESIRILEENGLGETATCIRRIKYFSQILLSSNQLVEAENVQRKLLHALELSKGWDSLDTVTAAEALALTLQSLGNLTEAKDLLQRCLDARKKILPKDHIQVASNMLHLARVGLLNFNRLRKLNITEARAELDDAKVLVDDSIRISKEALDGSSKKQNSLRSSSVQDGSAKEQQTALVVLLQALDVISLLDITKCEIETEEPTFPFDAELALRECISIFHETRTRSLLDCAEVKTEYLSCLKRLTNIIFDNMNQKKERSGELKELVDEAKFIQGQLSSNRNKKS